MSAQYLICALLPQLHPGIVHTSSVAPKHYVLGTEVRHSFFFIAPRLHTILSTCVPCRTLRPAGAAKSHQGCSLRAAPPAKPLQAYARPARCAPPIPGWQPPRGSAAVAAACLAESLNSA